MTNWKNLRSNPPVENCNVCVKVGDNYETYKFKRHSDIGRCLNKFTRDYDAASIPKEAMYINLDEIK